MKKIVKYLFRILAGFAVLIILLAASLFLIGYFYTDEIEQKIVAELNKSLTVEIKVTGIDVSLFKNFPKASVELTQIRTEESKIAPLVTAGSLSLLFDIYDILSGDYNIGEMILRDATLNIIVHEDGSDNYHILKKTESTTRQVRINLNRILLEKVRFVYFHHPSDQEYNFSVDEGQAKGAFSSAIFTLNFEGNITSHHIRSGKAIFLTNQSFKTRLKTDVDSNRGVFSVQDGKVESGDVSLNLTGMIKSGTAGRQIDVDFKSENTSLKKFMELLPADLISGIHDYKPNGDLSFNGKISGLFSGGVNPSIKVNFSLDNGILHFNNPRFVIRNISFSGSFDNGESRSNATSVIRIGSFTAGLNTGNIAGEMILNNLNHPGLLVSISSNIRLDKLDEMIEMENLQTISGDLKFDLKFSNTLDNIKHLKAKDFISSKTSGSMKLSQVSLQMKNDPVVYSDLNGSFRFNNKDLVVEYFSGKIGKSDFTMKGYFLNILAFAISPGETIKVKADVTSTDLDMADLLSHKKDNSGERYRLRFSDKINFDLDLNIKKFTFGSFHAQDISGNVVLKDKKLRIAETTFKAMDGKTMITGSVDGNYTDKFLISFTTGLESVNIEKMFYELGEFGQQNITSRHLRGRVDATIHYRSFIDPELNIDPSSVYALGDLTVSEGELIRYTPLYKLSKYLKQRELEHIRFSTLKNQIEIKDEMVYIPEMDIQSTTLDLRLSGTHTFGNSIDYHISILLSDLFSKNEKRQKEEVIDGIFPEDDGLGKTTIFLSMKGNVDDPDISLDTKAVKKKIASGLKQEQQNIRDVFENEFGSSRNDESGSKVGIKNKETETPRKDFRIEWEETKADTSIHHEIFEKQVKSQKKKPAKKEFVIEWDEENDTIR